MYEYADVQDALLNKSWPSFSAMKRGVIKTKTKCIEGF